MPLRESSFLENPRTPPAIREAGADPAMLHVTSASAAAASAAAASAAAAAAAAAATTSRRGSSSGSASTAPQAATPRSSASVPSRTSVTRLAHALSSLAEEPVVHIPDLSRLTILDDDATSSPSGGGQSPGGSQHGSGLQHSSPALLQRLLELPTHRGFVGSGLHEVSPMSSGFWCTACVITRQAALSRARTHALTSPLCSPKPHLSFHPSSPSRLPITLLSPSPPLPITLLSPSPSSPHHPPLAITAGAAACSVSSIAPPRESSKSFAALRSLHRGSNPRTSHHALLAAVASAPCSLRPLAP